MTRATGFRCAAWGLGGAVALIGAFQGLVATWSGLGFILAAEGQWTLRRWLDRQTRSRHGPLRPPPD